MSFSNHEQHFSLRSNELACPRARAVLGETGTKGLSVLLRVRCLPMAFPAAIRLDRSRRHVPSQKEAPKKTTEFHAHPKDLHMARMSHQQLGQDQWLRCPSWVSRVILAVDRHFRFTPINGHRQTTPACPVGAMCGRLRIGKDFLHAAGLVGAAMCSAFKWGSHDRWPEWHSPLQVR